MIIKIGAAVAVGAVVFFLAGPIHYYFRTAPQRAAFAALARESEEELRRVANSPSFSREEYRADMQRIREREARSQQLLAEKRRLRRQTWVIALVAGPLAGLATFFGLSWFAKRRRVPKGPTAPTD